VSAANPNMAVRLGKVMLGFAALTPTYGLSSSDARTSYHIALRMPKAQARPRPRIQLKYHMAQVSGQ